MDGNICTNLRAVGTTAAAICRALACWWAGARGHGFNARNLAAFESTRSGGQKLDCAIRRRPRGGYL